MNIRHSRYAKILALTACLASLIVTPAAEAWSIKRPFKGIGRGVTWRTPLGKTGLGVTWRTPIGRNGLGVTWRTPAGIDGRAFGIFLAVAVTVTAVVLMQYEVIPVTISNVGITASSNGAAIGIGLQQKVKSRSSDTDVRQNPPQKAPSKIPAPPVPPPTDTSWEQSVLKPQPSNKAIIEQDYKLVCPTRSLPVRFDGGWFDPRSNGNPFFETLLRGGTTDVAAMQICTEATLNLIASKATDIPYSAAVVTHSWGNVNYNRAKELCPALELDRIYPIRVAIGSPIPNTANSLTGLTHSYAGAGPGGIGIDPVTIMNHFLGGSPLPVWTRDPLHHSAIEYMQTLEGTDIEGCKLQRQFFIPEVSSPIKINFE